MKRKVYMKPAIAQLGMETDGSLLMETSGETKMEMIWNDGNGGRNADPESEVLSKEHDGSGGLWDDED